jgi:hypothetical protein
MASKKNNDMLDEYDFSKGIRGKYALRYQEGTNIIKLDEDVRKMFPNTKAVNEALRSLAGIIKQHKKHGVVNHSS